MATKKRKPVGGHTNPKGKTHGTTRAMRSIRKRLSDLERRMLKVETRGALE